MWRCWLCLAALAAYGQREQFEVASVKYAGQYDDDARISWRGGPGTSDPTHFFCENTSMLVLLSHAYGVDFNQISGPKWLDSSLYAVSANVPPGTTKDKFRKMLQQLIEERFQLVAHHTTQDLFVYELVVAKNGPKLAESAGDPGKPSAGVPVAARDDQGFPVLGPGRRHGLSQQNESGTWVTRETFRYFSMQEFVQELAWPLGEPPKWSHAISVAHVVDNTGLTGRYDFKLEYAGSHSPGSAFLQPGSDGQLSEAPTLFDAVQRQLGLKLQASKAPFDVLVIDRIEKIPARN